MPGQVYQILASSMEISCKQANLRSLTPFQMMHIMHAFDARVQYSAYIKPQNQRQSLEQNKSINTNTNIIVQFEVSFRF